MTSKKKCNKINLMSIFFRNEKKKCKSLVLRRHINNSASTPSLKKKVKFPEREEEHSLNVKPKGELGSKRKQETKQQEKKKDTNSQPNDNKRSEIYHPLVNKRQIKHFARSAEDIQRRTSSNFQEYSSSSIYGGEKRCWTMPVGVWACAVTTPCERVGSREKSHLSDFSYDPASSSVTASSHSLISNRSRTSCDPRDFPGQDCKKSTCYSVHSVSRFSCDPCASTDCSGNTLPSRSSRAYCDPYVQNQNRTAYTSSNHASSSRNPRCNPCPSSRRDCSYNSSKIFNCSPCSNTLDCPPPCPSVPRGYRYSPCAPNGTDCEPCCYPSLFNCNPCPPRVKEFQSSDFCRSRFSSSCCPSMQDPCCPTPCNLKYSCSSCPPQIGCSQIPCYTNPRLTCCTPCPKSQDCRSRYSFRKNLGNSCDPCTPCFRDCQPCCTTPSRSMFSCDPCYVPCSPKPLDCNPCYSSLLRKTTYSCDPCPPNPCCPPSCGSSRYYQCDSSCDPLVSRSFCSPRYTCEPCLPTCCDTGKTSRPICDPCDPCSSAQIFRMEERPSNLLRCRSHCDPCCSNGCCDPKCKKGPSIFKNVKSKFKGFTRDGTEGGQNCGFFVFKKRPPLSKGYPVFSRDVDPTKICTESTKSKKVFPIFGRNKLGKFFKNSPDKVGDQSFKQSGDLIWENQKSNLCCLNELQQLDDLEKYCRSACGLKDLPEDLDELCCIKNSSLSGEEYLKDGSELCCCMKDKCCPLDEILQEPEDIYCNKKDPCCPIDEILQDPEEICYYKKKYYPLEDFMKDPEEIYCNKTQACLLQDCLGDSIEGCRPCNVECCPPNLGLFKRSKAYRARQKVCCSEDGMPFPSVAEIPPFCSVTESPYGRYNKKPGGVVLVSDECSKNDNYCCSGRRDYDYYENCSKKIDLCCSAPDHILPNLSSSPRNLGSCCNSCDIDKIPEHFQKNNLLKLKLASCYNNLCRPEGICFDHCMPKLKNVQTGAFTGCSIPCNPNEICNQYFLLENKSLNDKTSEEGVKKKSDPNPVNNVVCSTSNVYIYKLINKRQSKESFPCGSSNNKSNEKIIFIKQTAKDKSCNAINFIEKGQEKCVKSNSSSNTSFSKKVRKKYYKLKEGLKTGGKSRDGSQNKYNEKVRTIKDKHSSSPEIGEIDINEEINRKAKYIIPNLGGLLSKYYLAKRETLEEPGCLALVPAKPSFHKGHKRSKNKPQRKTSTPKEKIRTQ